MRFGASIVAVTVALTVSAAQAGTVTQLNIFGSGGTEGIGSYTGVIKYDNDGFLDISLTNTSTFGNGGFITGLAFNIDGNANATYAPIGGDTFSNLTNPSTAPFGTFEEGAAIGGNWLGGGNPNSGIAFGVTRTFRFNITGADTALLTASSFISQTSSAGESVVVRFRGYSPNGSDKVPGHPGTVIPTPAAAGAGLALLSLLGLRRRQRD